MRRRLLAGVLGVGLLVSGLTGCGIPETSDVQVDGRAKAAEAGSPNGGSDEPPSRTASGSDSKAFVWNYLSAAASEPDRAYDRVIEFIAPESKGRLKEKQGSEVALTVVRLIESPQTTDNTNGTISVKLRVQQIGQLRADGVLAPPVATESEYTFALRGPLTAPDTGDPGLYVVDPPNVLLLSDRALRQYYQTRTVYFWNSDHTRLVPDQRYLPLAVPDERLVTEVVKWLTDGPTEWLAPGVRRLPDKTELINNATGGDGRWEVNLAMSGDDYDHKLDRLAVQLAWSLPELDGQLELKIRNQGPPGYDLGKLRLSHPAYQLGEDPQRFCVYDGAVHPLSFAGEPTGTVPVVAAANRNVVSAGLSRAEDEILAALVTTGSDRKQRLSVGTGPDPVTLFNRSREAYASIGRPVWLRSPDPRRPQGLVVADGKLFRFDGNAVMNQVRLNASGAVTAVAASLDGYRIAVIAGGALHVAAVNLDGGVVTLGPARRLVTSLGALSAVEWGGENTLVLAGSAGRPAIYEISVDGALETPLKQEIGARVTHLAGYPANPVGTTPTGAFMYEANGVAYRNNPFETIKREQVLEVQPPPAGIRPGNPTAPFFLY